MNQWANVVRMEMRPRMFLRTTEFFLWREGHTAHATAEEAQAEARKMLDVYTELATGAMAMPVFTGEKIESERFPGAVNTYTFEAMMQDGKALQAGNLSLLWGQAFAKSADIKYQSKEGTQEYVYNTSWGVSTRLIGALINTHSDDEGLRLPPALAPSQVVIVPIVREESEQPAVLAYCEKLRSQLQAQSALGEKVRVKVDARDRKSQDKRWDWIKKGVPVLIEVGPRDIEKGEACVVNRLDIKAKHLHETEAIVEGISGLLEGIQKGLYDQALAYRDANLRTDITEYAAFRDYFKKKAAFLPAGAELCQGLSGAATRRASRFWTTSR